MLVQNNVNKASIEQPKRDIITNHNTNATKFSEIVTNKRYDMAQQSIQSLVDKLDKQGKLLIEKQTISNLKDYKKTMRQLIKEVVDNGLELKDTHGMAPNGRRKNYKIINEIDKKLVDLTNEITTKEQNSLNILNVIGDLRGLILDLTT